VDGSQNIIIAYFAQKVCWNVACFQEKKEKFAENVAVNGRPNFWETRQF